MPNNRPETSELDCSRIFSGEVSLEAFLRDYWQQKPLLIRNAFPGFRSPLSADELAGLACEADVNARIVLEKDAERPWRVEYGPFDENRFATLPEQDWTLLVSDVEKHVAEVRNIMDCFRFIPDWRRDDLMFSYAPAGGSVGPHLDAYDVFLLQAHGRRNWMISHQHANEFLDNTDLSILARFDADEQWVLEPGDMLYLPPGIAHHGVALEPCITCSIGFRAPSLRAMVADYAEYIASKLPVETRYSDAGLDQQVHAAEISPPVLQSIADMLSKHIHIERDTMQRWLGQYLSENRSGLLGEAPDVPLQSFEQLHKMLDRHALVHAPASRYLFIRDNDAALLFVDGESFDVSQAFAECLCDTGELDSSKIMAAARSKTDHDVLLKLYNSGQLLLGEARD